MIIDKKQRREILIKIGDIIDLHCRPCGVSNNNEYCKEKCTTGKQLQELGVILDGGVQRQRSYNAAENFQKKRSDAEQIEELKIYFEHRKNGLSHLTTMKEMKMGSETMYKRINKWGHLFPEDLEAWYTRKQEMNEQQQTELVGKYLEQRRKGLSYKDACLAIKFPKTNMYIYLRRWGHKYPDTEEYYRYRGTK